MKCVVPNCLIWVLAVGQLQFLKGCEYPGATQLVAMKDEKQTFTSPNYPDNYPLDSQCRWRINGNSSRDVIHLTVLHSDIEPSFDSHGSDCYDYVQVYDGANSYAESLGQWCGTKKPSFHSSGPYMYIYFRSDRTSTGSGFVLQYVAEERDPSKGRAMDGDDPGMTIGGLFGYVILGWVGFIIVLKLLWDRLKQMKCDAPIHFGQESSGAETISPPLEVSVLSGAPPSYDFCRRYPNDSPPPYSSCQRIIPTIVISENYDLSDEFPNNSEHMPTLSNEPPSYEYINTNYIADDTDSNFTLTVPEPELEIVLSPRATQPGDTSTRIEQHSRL